MSLEMSLAASVSSADFSSSGSINTWRPIVTSALRRDFLQAAALAVSTHTVGCGFGQRILVDTRKRPIGVVKRALTEEAVMLLERCKSRVL
jgi:hypothetical protein